MSSQTLTKTAAASDIYRLLSACYYEPDKKMFLEENLFGQLYSALRLGLPHKAEVAEFLGSQFEDCDQEDLLVEYARLFVGPQELLAHPYGSVYLDGPKIIMGDSTLNAIEHYRNADFAVAAELHEMPDHIAIELEFLYLLSHNESHAEFNNQSQDAEMWRNRRLLFLKQHIGRWISFFSDKVRLNTSVPYYKTLADLTEQVILDQRMNI